MRRIRSIRRDVSDAGELRAEPFLNEVRDVLVKRRLNLTMLVVSRHKASMVFRSVIKSASSTPSFSVYSRRS